MTKPRPALTTRYARIGYDHGRQGATAFAHREGQPYDSTSINISYLYGHGLGAQEYKGRTSDRGENKAAQ